MDEKAQIQPPDRTLPLLQMRPGQVNRRAHDYKRNGTRSLYAAFDVATGNVLGRVSQRHRTQELLAFLRQIGCATDSGLDLHFILDNSSIHRTPAVRKWIEAQPRFHLLFTPTSASWLSAVESWFSQLENRALYRGVFTNVTELRNEIHRFITAHNAELAKPFVWTKSAESLIESHQRLSNKLSNGTSGAGHQRTG